MATIQQWWCPELAKLGYIEDLPRPCNMAIQATIASISAPEIHKAILDHERQALSCPVGAEPGQLLMMILGIEEWFSIYLLAQTIGVNAALKKLKDFMSCLTGWVEDDASELQNAQHLASAILAALIAVEKIVNLAVKGQTSSSPASSSSVAPHTPPAIGSSSSASSSADGTVSLPLDICSQSKGNPLLDNRWFSKEEEEDVVVLVTPPSADRTVSDNDCFNGEPFVPVLPARHIEWEVLNVNGEMWKISNINTLAPISQTMWMAMGSISQAELAECKRRALLGVTVSNKPPILVSRWPLTTFGTKYKCNITPGAKIRGPLLTNNKRLEDHKSKLWNWLRPFFRCTCYFTASGACHGQILWFDHAIWYMINHLDEFFNAASIQARFVHLMRFLSGEARNMVLDQISFNIIRQLMIDGAVELVRHPEQPFFTQSETCFTLRTIECLMKPSSFTIQMEEAAAAAKRAINLSRQAGQGNKRKNGIYVNTATVPIQSRGRAQNNVGLGRGAMINTVRPIPGNTNPRQALPVTDRQIGAVPLPLPMPTTSAPMIVNLDKNPLPPVVPPVIIHMGIAPSVQVTRDPFWFQIQQAGQDTSPLPRQNLNQRFQ